MELNMASTPKMNPIKCQNGKIVAAFEVTENETVWDSKNTWNLRGISPSDLKTTVINDGDWSKLKGIDLLDGFSQSLPPTRKWPFFQDILMLERLSRDTHTDNYTNICNGIDLYMANNPFALMRSRLVEGGEWGAYAIRLPARNGKHFFWIKGAPKLIAEDSQYQMTRWIGLAAEFETSNKRNDSSERQDKMTGKQKNLLLVRKDLGNGCSILINQEYDHIRVNERKDYADIIEIKTWPEKEKEARKERIKSSFYSASKLLDLDVVVLWKEKIPREFPWKECLVKSTEKYPTEELISKNQVRLKKGNEAVCKLGNALHRSNEKVNYITITNNSFALKPSTLEKFIEGLEGESKIGDYVKLTIDELERHHQNAAIRPVIEGSGNSMNERLFDNGKQVHQQISYAAMVKKGVNQLPVERFAKNESKIKGPVKGESVLDRQNAEIPVNGKTSRFKIASNRIVRGSSDNCRMVTRSISHAEVAKKHLKNQESFKPRFPK